MCLEKDVHVLLSDSVCDFQDIVSESLLGDSGGVHSTRLDEHVEDHINALHLAVGKLLSDPPDHLPLSEFAHYVRLAAPTDHVRTQALVIATTDFDLEPASLDAIGISDREGISYLLYHVGRDIQRLQWDPHAADVIRCPIGREVHGLIYQVDFKHLGLDVVEELVCQLDLELPLDVEVRRRPACCYGGGVVEGIELEVEERLHFSLQEALT